MSPLGPRHGDILITKRPAAPGYLLRTLPSVPQLIEGSYASAVNRAVAVAMREQTDVWYVEHGQPPICVARHRTRQTDTA
jgi:hypothetical protein